MLEVRKSFYVADADSNIGKKELISIAGSNTKVMEMYFDGTLNTLLFTGCGDLYCTKSLGRKSSKPTKLVDLFRLVSKSYGNNGHENLTSLEIGYVDDGRRVLVSARCSGSSSKVYPLFFDIVDCGLKVCDFSIGNISDKSLIPVLERKVKEVVEWGNSVSPVPLFSIEYYFSREKNTSVSIGSGNFYIGLSEACIENGVAGLNTKEDNKKGEYALIFLEE